MSAAGPAAPLRVFFSYAHADEPLRDTLVKHLSLLKRQAVIEDWHDRRLTGGTEWAGQIDEHLQRAEIILLLVSPDFLSSDYCYDVELQRAMARHESRDARVVPIILRPVDWQGAPFAKLQCLPKDAKPVTAWSDEDTAFLDIAQGIRRIAEDLQRGTGQSGSGATRLPPPLRRTRFWVGIAVGLLAIAAGFAVMNARAAAYLKEGDAFLNIADYSRASEAFERAKMWNPLSASARWGLQKSKAATMRADAPGFVRTVAELAKRRPDDPDLNLLEGDLAYANGRLDDALKRYDAAKRANPQLSEAFFRTGVVYFDQGRLPEAKAMFERALTANTLAPMVPRYRNNLAYTLGKLGSYEEAIAEYGKNSRYALSAVESARLLWLVGGPDHLARAGDHLEQAITWLTDEATGRQPDNRAPWVFEAGNDAIAFRDRREKLCYVRLALSATQFLRSDETSAVKTATEVRESCKGVLADLQAVLRSDLSLVARTNPSMQGKVNAYRTRILDPLG